MVNFNLIFLLLLNKTGDKDCSDGSDESSEICHHKQCDPETQFQCTNGKCIPKLWFVYLDFFL